MKTQTIESARIAHHRAIESLRAPGCKFSGLQIWRKLCTLERICLKATTAACNGETVRLFLTSHGGRGVATIALEPSFESASHESFCAWVNDEVRRIFGHVPPGFFLNWDARGHALKLDPEQVTIPEGMQTDWGRNGILAAQIN